MANSSNITLRTLPEGVDRPLLYDEIDTNFKELIILIDEFNTHIGNTGDPHPQYLNETGDGSFVMMAS